MRNILLCSNNNYDKVKKYLSEHHISPHINKHDVWKPPLPPVKERSGVWPDIMQAVFHCATFMETPTERHYLGLVGIVQYLKQFPDRGITFTKIYGNKRFYVFCDTDFAI